MARPSVGHTPQKENQNSFWGVHPLGVLKPSDKYGLLELLVAYEPPPIPGHKEAWAEVRRILELATSEIAARGRRETVANFRRASIKRSYSDDGQEQVDFKLKTVDVVKPPARAIAAFNKFARDVPVNLGVRSDGDTEFRTGGNPRVRGVIQLWQVYFRPRAWDRVKRCARCNLWFVDKTRNCTARFGSRECKDRFFNRGKRRASKEAKEGARQVRSPKQARNRRSTP